MVGELAKPVGETNLPKVELEPIEKFPILFLGAGTGTGRALALKYAKKGYQVIAGTRSPINFESLRDEIKEEGGVEPIPFLADVTKPDQVRQAYSDLPFGPDKPMHYFDLAAGGFDFVMFSLVRDFITLQRAYREGKISVELLEEGTQKIHDFVRNGEVKGIKVFDCAVDVNYKAPVEIMKGLIASGHIREGSKIVTLSSNISDEIDPDNIDAFRGPQFYLPVGWTKEKAAREIRYLADLVGAVHVNAVAPTIRETETANVFTGEEGLQNREKGKRQYGLITIMEAALSKLSPEELKARGIELPLPFIVVTQDEVVNGIYAELQKAKQSGKVYIDQGGKISYQRPQSWIDHPALPFL